MEEGPESSLDKKSKKTKQGIELGQPKGEKSIERLSQQKCEIHKKLKAEISIQSSIAGRLQSHNFDEEWLRYKVRQQKKEIDFLELCLEKMNFANKAYLGREITSGTSKDDVDKHKLNIRLVHGKNSMAEEKRLLKEIKSSEETTDDPPISLESLKYSSWFEYQQLKYIKDPKAAADRLRELKADDLEKEKRIATATVNGKIWNALGSKKDLQDEVKIMSTCLEEIRANHLSVRKKNNTLKRELEGVDKKVNSLTEQLKDVERRIKVLHNIGK